jgi:hypothetical protein
MHVVGKTGVASKPSNVLCRFERSAAGMRTALQFCILMDWISSNAARDVTVITPRGQEAKPVVPPRKEDIRALLHTTQADPAFSLELLFACLTGAAPESSERCAGRTWTSRRAPSL